MREGCPAEFCYELSFYFFLSFMKISVKVLKKLVWMQRRFLWGGPKGETKVDWVKWNDVCRPEKKGGLGVNELRLVNFTLLSK